MLSFKSLCACVLTTLALALPACGNLPRPFQPEEKYLPIVRPISPQAAEVLRERNNLVIQDIVNAPGPGGPRLAASMAVALRNEGIAADVVAQEGDMTLAGIADIKTFPNDIEVHIVWYVLDARGRRIGQQDQFVRGRFEDWQDGNDRLLSRIALLGAPELGRLIKGLIAAPPVVAQTPSPPAPPVDECKGKKNIEACRAAAAKAAAKAPPVAPVITQAASPATAPSPTRPPVQPISAPAPAPGPAPGPRLDALGFYVAKVSGAPGDGNDSLTGGMRLALGRRGFALFAKSDGKSFAISGKVTMTPVDAEREKISVVWTVSDPDNKKLGDIEQSNLIPKGSLAGEWGGVAKEITVAAAEGLLDLLGKIAKGGTP